MIEIKPSYDSDLYGVLRRYTSSFDLTNSSHNSNDFVSYILDNSTNKYWCSASIEWQYFTISFKTFYFNLKSYAVQTGSWNLATSEYPKEWVVSGFDGKEWHNISTVAVSDMHKNNYAKRFSTDSNKYFKQFRVTGTGPSYGGHYYFCINNFDMFGKISYRYIRDICTSKTKSHLMVSLFLIIFQIS